MSAVLPGRWAEETAAEAGAPSACRYTGRTGVQSRLSVPRGPAQAGMQGPMQGPRHIKPEGRPCCPGDVCGEGLSQLCSRHPL